MFAPLVFYHRVQSGILHTRAIGANGDCVGSHTGAALIAVQRNEQKIIAVGDAAKGINRSGVDVYAPFSHPRVAVHEFEAATKLLRWFADKSLKDASGTTRLARRLPCYMVIQVQRDWDSALTDIEKRALFDAAKQAGASRWFTCEHPDLLTDLQAWEIAYRKTEGHWQVTDGDLPSA